MADKNNPFFPFDFNKFGFADMMKNIEMPGFNPEALLESQRRNLEALSRASQVTAEGLSDASRRQAEFFNEAMGELTATTEKLSQAKTTNDMLTQQGAAMNQAFERALNNMRELADMIGESNAEAFDVISQRVEQSIDELQNLTKTPRAKKK